MSAKGRVRDGRQLADIQIARAGLSMIGEHCERRLIAPARSTYLALVECAGEPGGWTQAALAKRAGIGPGLLKESLATLEALGFLRAMDDGSLQLSSPSGSGEIALPVVEPALPHAAPIPASADNPRAVAFYEFHAARVERIGGGRPRRTPAALSAAEKILALQSDSAQIRARLEFALGHRFYASKALTLCEFERWWARINADYLAESGQQSRSVAIRPEARPARTSYESERVEVSR